MEYNGIKLKPCPFCGRDDTLNIAYYKDGGKKWWYVECVECMASGPVHGKEYAITAWNERVGAS